MQTFNKNKNFEQNFEEKKLKKLLNLPIQNAFAKIFLENKTTGSLKSTVGHWLKHVYFPTVVKLQLGKACKMEYVDFGKAMLTALKSDYTVEKAAEIAASERQKGQRFVSSSLPEVCAPSPSVISQVGKEKAIQEHLIEVLWQYMRANKWYPVRKSNANIVITLQGKNDFKQQQQQEEVEIEEECCMLLKDFLDEFRIFLRSRSAEQGKQVPPPRFTSQVKMATLLTEMGYKVVNPYNVKHIRFWMSKKDGLLMDA